MSARLAGRRLLTVAEFCAAADVPEQTARAQLREGRLRGRNLNADRPGRVRARWRVFASEAARYRANDGRG